MPVQKLYSRDFFFSLGLIRMNSPATVMIPPGGNMSSSMMAPGPNSELQPRTPRPASQSGNDLHSFRIRQARARYTDHYKIQLSLMQFLTAQLKCYVLYKICPKFKLSFPSQNFSLFSYQLYPSIPKSEFFGLLSPVRYTMTENSKQ